MPTARVMVRSAMNSKRDSANLDFLRAAAVLFVVTFHLMLFFQSDHVGRLNFPIGHWGVLIFFVHTSLVLMYSLERQEGSERGAPIYWSFLLRRCFRIYPLSCFVVLLIYLLRLPVGHLQDGWFSAIHFQYPISPQHREHTGIRPSVEMLCLNLR